MEADRLALGPVLERLIDERMAARRCEATEEATRWYRFLHVMKARLLSGTGVKVARIGTLEEWMKVLGFRSARDVDSHGWGPLRFAVIEGRADLATALRMRVPM